jgi:NodT family efflux transporter outer membrane factor (OMF) lipoprotein
MKIMKRIKPLGYEFHRWLTRSCVAGIASLMVVLSACVVGPKYSRPTVQTPPAYKEQTASTDKEIENWKRAQPSDEIARGKWWEVFHDPSLNVLEDRVNISNQNLKAAEAQFREARALVKLNRSSYYPTVSVGTDVTVSHPSVNRSFRPSTSAPTFADYVLSGDLSYEADLWGRIRRLVEESVANAQASAADLEVVRLSVQSELAADYFTLRALDAEKQLLDSTVAAYEKALELTTNRYKGGVASGADVALAETQLESTRAQAVDIGVQRAQLEHAMALLVGDPASTFSFLPSPISGPPPQIPAGLPSELLERRPDVAAAERSVASANAGIGVAKAAYFPVLSLVAGVGFEATHLANWLSWPSHLWSVGPSLVQTVFDGGRRRAVSDQAQAVYDATVASYRESVLTAFKEVEDNLAALRILSEEARVQDAAVRAAEKSRDLSINRYKGGVATYLEVIIAQSATLTNQRVSVDILGRQMVASVLLIKALGGGWDASNLPAAQDLRSSVSDHGAKAVEVGKTSMSETPLTPSIQTSQ